ncbi:MAG: hypothetical protein EWV89_17155 [Microcystis wesenbergii Mw_QC_B_20070930_S4]|nr:MAG: hypothetical protein EWV73_06860 [Microcystis wesenbergii Mw_QC_B_20070930_S4D]TRV10441.1 MAG: hypothetical protein EWV89_17155 [Microcystis wesenbergii Mw_QC_B_20070930_S4]
MRNVNLNILKSLASINNFCLSLANMGLGVSHQLSVISYQLSVISYQLSVISHQCQLFSPFSQLRRSHLPSPRTKWSPLSPSPHYPISPLPSPCSRKILSFIKKLVTKDRL